MKNHVVAGISVCCGLFYGLLIAAASRFIVHNGERIFRAVSGLLGINSEQSEYIANILAGLNDASVKTPWGFAIFLGLVAGCIFAVLHAKNMDSALLVMRIAALVLILPLIAATIALSNINDIRPARILWHQFMPGRKSAPEVVSVSTTVASEGEIWNWGFGRRQIIPESDGGEPLYIAGYNNGLEISGVLDYCEARAVWLDSGDKGILLISVDCIGLDSGTVARMRQSLSDIDDCAVINIISTHTHAGADTLGLWGPIGIDGKNDAYMDALYKAVEEAAREAHASRQPGRLYLSSIETHSMFRDSRDPQVFDPNIYQLRMDCGDEGPGLRMLFYGSHAESLRGDNSLLSRDFPGILCDRVAQATGDNTVFFSSAAGGLIMTKEFVSNTRREAVNNLNITANRLIDYVLSISEEGERELAPALRFATAEFCVPMDNTAFALYKGLGILTNRAIKAKSATGYGVQTELSVMMLDDAAVTLIPGEPFPELITGAAYGDANPEGINPPALESIARERGIETMFTIGLANDEIGYIVPPSDFLVHPKLPYFEKIEDHKGENHYEETNSVGPFCADALAQAFAAALDALE